MSCRTECPRCSAFWEVTALPRSFVRWSFITSDKSNNNNNNNLVVVDFHFSWNSATSSVISARSQSNLPPPPPCFPGLQDQFSGSTSPHSFSFFFFFFSWFAVRPLKAFRGLLGLFAVYLMTVISSMKSLTGFAAATAAAAITEKCGFVRRLLFISNTFKTTRMSTMKTIDCLVCRDHGGGGGDHCSLRDATPLVAFHRFSSRLRGISGWM